VLCTTRSLSQCLSAILFNNRKHSTIQQRNQGACPRTDPHPRRPTPTHRVHLALVEQAPCHRLPRAGINRQVISAGSARLLKCLLLQQGRFLGAVLAALSRVPTTETCGNPSVLFPKHPHTRHCRQRSQTIAMEEVRVWIYISKPTIAHIPQCIHNEQAQ